MNTEKTITFSIDYHKRNTEKEIHQINRYIALLIDCTFTYVVAPKKDKPHPLHSHGYFTTNGKLKDSELRAILIKHLDGFSFDVTPSFFDEGWINYMRSHSPIFHTTDDAVIKTKMNLRKV